MPENQDPPKTTYGGWVARRVEQERSGRGWSLETTARKMAEVGCPIASTAILKIESGDPPRKITVDEYFAFSRVFEIPLEELALPPEVSEDDELTALAVKLREAQEEALGPIERWRSIFEEFRRKSEGRADDLTPLIYLQHLAPPPTLDAQAWLSLKHEQ